MMPLKSLKNLGKGGFGVVDLVETEDGREYARKTFSAPPGLPPHGVENVQRRFAREARTQSGIRHRNIVPVLHSELAAIPPFYLMPVAVCSLQDDLDADRTLGGNWLRAVMDIVAALDELHQTHIFHRDLTPRNVLRYHDPSDVAHPFFYAVSDFGLIAMNESRISLLTVTGMAKGTDYYTAPEITSDLRKASPQSDIFSLGCIIHEMVGTEPRVPCHEIKEPGDYGAILRNCTRAAPGRRFQSVRSVLDALFTINTAVPTIVTAKGAEFGDQLASGQSLDQASWRALIDFVEDNETEADTNAVLGRITLDQISDLCSHSIEFADRLGMVYANWVGANQFPFERCDPLANVLELFVLHCSFETKADALMAMLQLGTSHNRWYVERKFCNLCGPAMDVTLARRLSVEFRALGPNICTPIEHLERSIGVDQNALHPLLQQAFSDVCR